MTTPRFSSDPEQQAEMAAQWHLENRLLGINPYRDDYYPEDYPDEDEPEWGEDDDQDDDGQPDEAQEWHDFDPEC